MDSEPPNAAGLAAPLSMAEVRGFRRINEETSSDSEALSALGIAIILVWPSISASFERRRAFEDFKEAFSDSISANRRRIKALVDFMASFPASSDSM